jgi:hypothetical protein
VNGVEQLHALLRIVSLTLEDHDRAGKFFHHFRLAALQLFLAPAQLLEFALLPLDHFLLALEGQQLFLGLLDLVVEVLPGEGIFVGKVEELVVGARAVSHGDESRVCRLRIPDFSHAECQESAERA